MISSSFICTELILRLFLLVPFCNFKWHNYVVSSVYLGAQVCFRLNVSTKALSCVHLKRNSIGCSYSSMITCPLAGMSPFFCTWLLQNSSSVHCVNMCCYNLFNKQAAGQQLNRIKAGRKAKLRKIVWGRVKSENSQANR